MADYDYTDVNTGEDYIDDQMEDIFREYMNDNFGDIDVVGYTYGAGNLLHSHDYTAFREEFNNWLDSEIAEGNYREYVEPECEDCGAILSQNDVTESLYIYDRLVCPSCGEDDNEEEN